MFLYQNNNKANFSYPTATQPTICRSSVILQEHSGKYPQHPRRQCRHRCCSPPAVRHLPLVDPVYGLRASGAVSEGFVTVHLLLKRKGCAGERHYCMLRTQNLKMLPEFLPQGCGGTLLIWLFMWGRIIAQLGLLVIRHQRYYVLHRHHNVLCSTVCYAGKQYK